MDLLAALHSGRSVFAAELRPPRAELAAAEGMDAWIDTYHAVQRLTRQGTYVFLTDSAVGEPEEDNLRIWSRTLATTCHAIEWCRSSRRSTRSSTALRTRTRAHQSGFPALVVLGGDKTLGVPRVVAHAWQLREFLRKRNPSLILGGWANPHADAERQVDFLTAPEFLAEFYLTQVVSHHHVERIAQFILAATGRGVELPGIFGVFFYRSANPRTLAALAGSFQFPRRARARVRGRRDAEEICARTIRALLDVGARHFYISNLPIGRAQQVLANVLERVGGGEVTTGADRSRGLGGAGLPPACREGLMSR
jgi:5,10-methylenetetrahydrofolate reductase